MAPVHESPPPQEAPGRKEHRIHLQNLELKVRGIKNKNNEI